MDGSGSIDDVPFEIRGFSLAQLFLALGVILLLISFGDYFVYGTNGGGGFGSLTIIYAVPVFLAGLSLTYAELDPAEAVTEKGAEGLFDKEATDVLKKIKKDVTRHRYGDNAHLDSSLKALGLDGTGRYPQLFKIIESKAENGELEFTLLFESKDVPFTTWADPMKLVACDRFFGPGVWSEIFKYDSSKRVAALKLTTGTRPDKEAVPAATAMEAP